MNENDSVQLTPISEARTPEEIAEFWDSHSLADYWDETQEVEFEVRAKRRRRSPLSTSSYFFGDPEQQTEFSNRHAQLLESFHDLKEAIDVVILNRVKQERDDRIIYLLGRAIFEGFNSIVLLCANGYLHTSKSILRAMFEQAVTLAYLNLHRDEIIRYDEYHWVIRRKRIPDYQQNNIKLSDESIQEIEENFNRIKNNYMRTDCKECKTQRLNHMWTKKDIITMSKETEFPFQIVELAYYRGLDEAHGRIDGLLGRLQLQRDGSFFYNDPPDVSDADTLLLTAHYLVVRSLGVLKDYFNLEEMNDPLSRCAADFTRIWESLFPAASTAHPPKDAAPGA